MTESEEEKEGGNDLVINLLYALVVGINVYMIVDQATDGALSREVSLKLYHLRGKFTEWKERNAMYKSEAGKVVWEAMKVVEGGEA